MRVLIAEDAPDVANDLKSALSGAGFVTDIATNGEDAWFKGETEDYDVVILDLGLPRLDGLTVLKKWRANAHKFPVLILTARGDWTEKVEGIEAGADDYLAKPFAMGELLARLRGLIRRTSGHASPHIQIGQLSIDTTLMIAQRAGETIRLSALEFRLLDFLAHRLDRIVSTEEIAEHLYGRGDDGRTNAIEAIVTRVRRKIGAGVIENRKGLGYVLSSAA